MTGWTNDCVWVFDFGGTNVKRAQAIYKHDMLTGLEQLPSVFVPTFGQTNDLFDFMVQTIATTISSGNKNTRPQAIYISIANYAQGCQLATDNPYGRLNTLGTNVCDRLSQAVTGQIGYPTTVVTFIHDGTAAAKVYAGAANTAVITMGTSLGMGFPPPNQLLRLISENFSIKQLTSIL